MVHTVISLHDLTCRDLDMDPVREAFYDYHVT